jgi:hypothetical protein
LVNPRFKSSFFFGDKTKKKPRQAINLSTDVARNNSLYPAIEFDKIYSEIYPEDKEPTNVNIPNMNA